MNFNEFKIAVDNQFHKMEGNRMFKMRVSKTELWDTYLGSFPEGSNPIYRERTHHDCQCCKQFIRVVGNVCAIVDGKPTSIWDIDLEDPNYQAVADGMKQLVETADIDRPFFHYESIVGTSYSRQLEEDNSITTWDHFSVTLPSVVVMQKDAIATHISKLRSSREVFNRALEEINISNVDTVLELIDQKSLYRGDEHRATLGAFRTQLIAYDAYKPGLKRKLHVWEMAFSLSKALLGIRNSAIGTLLTDLSEGKELDHAVGSFEAMVAPANYKRPKALITKGMIIKAKEKVEELGLTESLQRRHAVPEDLTINNVLFADRSAKEALGDVFDQLQEQVLVNPQKLSKVEEITAELFISEILPQVSTIEVLMENRLTGNLMTLVAPANASAPNMLMWDNNFSWTYNGEVADSMKQRVKAAGGNIEGVIRFSIQWNDDEDWNHSDYDAWCIEPGGNKIFYGSTRNSHTTGNLDVDIIQPRQNVPAVENITWSNQSKMETGLYQFAVHAYSARDNDKGFTAELEHDGEIRSYTYNKPLRQSNVIVVADVNFDALTNSFEIVKELPSSVASREIWGIATQQFRKCTMIMNSPNHWDGVSVGNKHLFFILEGCAQPGSIRGFYNEFLMESLRENRKVFEHLGSQMRVAESDHQLSGVGFSTTQRNSVTCRVSGSFNRTLKIIF